MKTNPSDYAFTSGFKDPNGAGFTFDGGLTKREYFAAMALQGILANQDFYGISVQGNLQVASWKAIDVADALIAELNKPQSEGEK